MINQIFVVNLHDLSGGIGPTAKQQQRKIFPQEGKYFANARMSWVVGLQLSKANGKNMLKVNK